MRTWGAVLISMAVWWGCGGDDWSSVSGTPSSLSFTDVWAFSDDQVWVVDGGPDVHVYDGSGWNTMDTPALGLTCIFALSATEVYLCAGSDVLHYDGATFSVNNLSTPTGVDDSSDIWASSSADVWVVGYDGRAAHYDGSSWSGHNIGSQFNSSVWGSGPEDVYAMGTFDLVHYDGTSWSEIELDGSGAGDGQVWGTGPTDVWVLTDSYDLHHYDGSAWSIIETDFVGDLAAVWGPAPDDLWAVGSAGEIAHYNGSSWSEVTHQRIGAPYLRMFTAVHGSSSTNVWAVGHQLGEGGSTGIIYRYDP